MVFMEIHKNTSKYKIFLFVGFIGVQLIYFLVFLRIYLLYEIK